MKSSGKDASSEDATAMKKEGEPQTTPEKEVDAVCGDAVAKKKEGEPQTTPKPEKEVDDGLTHAQPRLIPDIIPRSERKTKIPVKPNLARDLSILLGFIAFMILFSVTTLKDVGTGEVDPLNAVKASRTTPGQRVRSNIEALSKLVSKVTPTSPKSEDEICDLYLAESSIPEVGLGVFSGRSFSEGDVVMGPSIAFPTFNSIGGNHVLDGWSLMSQHGMIIRPHPKLANVEGGLVSCAQESCNADAASIEAPSSSAFIAIRAISPGEEIFMPFPSEELLESYHSLFPNVPTLESYALADEIIAHEERGLTDEKLITVGRRQKKQIKTIRTVDGRALKVLKKTVSRFDSKVASLLPENAHEMFQNSIHGSALASMENRTVDWVYDNGVCFDGIQPSMSTDESSTGGAVTKRRIRKGGVIATLPLYVVETGLDNVPASVMNHCFGHDEMPFLLCPLSHAHNLINHKSSTQEPGALDQKCEDGPNAEYKWSTWNPPGSSRIHDIGVEEVREKYKLGLSFDLIATRDMEKGEEVFIDYGPNARDSEDGPGTPQRPMGIRDELVPDRWKSKP